MRKLIKNKMMFSGLLATSLLTCALSAQALTPTPAAPQTKEVVFTNATIHVGNGKVLENAQLAFSEGKITRVGHFKMAATGNEVNLQGKHIYPGFILPNSDLGLTEVDSFKATRDMRETGQMNPNVRSLIAYNTDSERIPPMRFNGVLLAQTTPSGGLVSGTSSVVQLDAWNWEDAAVKADDGLHVNWPANWRKQFDWATFTVQLKQDKSYDKKVSAIKALFADAKNTNNSDNLKLAAVKSVYAGDKKVFVHSNNPKAIIESVNYFKGLGVDVVLVTGQGAASVKGFIKDNNVPVIIESVHGLPSSNERSVDAAYALPTELAQAGINVALSYPGSMSSRNLAFTAGTTVAYGNDKETALSMITLNPAKILGIDKDYGSLEVGKSATLFISEGDALDMRGNILTEAYIDGRKIELHTRQQELNDRFAKKYAE